MTVAGLKPSVMKLSHTTLNQETVFPFVRIQKKAGYPGPDDHGYR